MINIRLTLCPLSWYVFDLVSSKLCHVSLSLSPSTAHVHNFTGFVKQITKKFDALKIC